jgi:hypothetical protein
MYNKLIPDGSLVFDFGCGSGSLGYVNDNNNRGIVVDGFDRDVNNPAAKYHDLSEVKGHYDYMISSMVFEHMTIDDIHEITEWAKKHVDHLIIGLPNSENVFMSTIMYSVDITHKRPYDSAYFLHFMEKNGYELKRMVWFDFFMFTGYKPSTLFRVLFALATATSPFYSVCYVLDVVN